MDPYRIAEEWGIERTMWAREWSTLSGGEGQRIALAIAIGLGGAEVVLLDGKPFLILGKGIMLGLQGGGSNELTLTCCSASDINADPRTDECIR